MKRVLHFVKDFTGVGFWRHLVVANTLNMTSQISGQIHECVMVPPHDENSYLDVQSIVLEMWCSSPQRQFVEKFLRPVCSKFGIRLLYEQDDLTLANEIPRFNSGWATYQSDELQDNIKAIMSACDFVVTTTPPLRDSLISGYNLDRPVVVVPNTLPYWWIGDKFHVDYKLQQFRRFKSKPRIGIVSSASHFAYKSEKPLPDDLDTILPVINQTLDDVQWVVLGIKPKQIETLIDQKKIEWHPCCPILAYPSALERLQLQAIVSPLTENLFNQCKSDIKFLESAALGHLLFAPNMKPYNETTTHPENLYNSAEELKSGLLKLKFMSAGAYEKAIRQQYEFLNQPRVYGDVKLNSSWLEANGGMWLEIYGAKQ